jgi:hypothetical protein
LIIQSAKSLKSATALAICYRSLARRRWLTLDCTYLLRLQNY